MYFKSISISIVLISFSFSNEIDSSSIYLRYNGSKAFEFRYSGLFSLGGFKGANFSYKKFLFKDRAYRVGLNFIGRGENEDRTNENYYVRVYNDTLSRRDTTLYDTGSKDIDFSISLETQYIRYSEPSNGISLCYGAGPILGYSQSIDEFVPDEVFTSDIRDYVYENKNNIKRVYIGLSTMLGVEWFFHKSASLHAEYHNSIIIGKLYKKYSSNLVFRTGDKSINSFDSSGNYFQTSRGMWSGVSIYFR